MKRKFILSLAMFVLSLNVMAFDSSTISSDALTQDDQEAVADVSEILRPRPIIRRHKHFVGCFEHRRYCLRSVGNGEAVLGDSSCYPGRAWGCYEYCDRHH